MSSYRDAVLEGTLEAAQLHADHATSSPTSNCDAVDVFQFIDRLNISLLFQKLNGLLGAFMNFQRPGILVTTERTLAIQRFTAAHELGHSVLKHPAGVDDDSMLTRTPFGQGHYDAREMAADTFAAMFLMPEPLINAVAQRQHWDHLAIRRPEIVYQMALRLGVSFEALTRTLVKHGILTFQESLSLSNVQVKLLKQRLLTNSVIPPNWRCNVWDLTEKDMGCFLIAEPNDYFVVRLREMSGAGYVWNIDEARNAGFQILADQRESTNSQDIGSDVERVFTAQAPQSHSSSFTAVQARPWDESDVAGNFHIHLNVIKPDIGFTLRHRMEALAA